MTVRPTQGDWVLMRDTAPDRTSIGQRELISHTIVSGLNNATISPKIDFDMRSSAHQALPPSTLSPTKSPISSVVNDSTPKLDRVSRTSHASRWKPRVTSQKRRQSTSVWSTERKARKIEQDEKNGTSARDSDSHRSPGLEQVFVSAAPTPSLPPQITKVLHPLVSLSRRQRKANQRKTRATQGDFLLMREMTLNKPEIAQHASQQALDPDSGESSPNDGEEMEDQISNISQQRVSRASPSKSPWTVPPTTTMKARGRMDISNAISSSPPVKSWTDDLSTSAPTSGVTWGATTFYGSKQASFRQLERKDVNYIYDSDSDYERINEEDGVTNDSASEYTQPRTYKGEQQKADMSRANRKKVIKKSPFVLKYTLSTDDTQNEVSRKRTQFIALGRASQ
jgi:hypothetical protein